MKYRIEISPEAVADAEEAYLWLCTGFPSSAARWFNGLLDAVNSLERFPARCSLAPENSAFRAEIRQLLYGERTHVYRVLFTVAGKTVRVLRILHGARRHLRPGPESM